MSVQALDERARARYLDLAVFPEEEPIPLAVLRVLWAPLGRDEDDVEDLAQELVDRSLARWADEARTALTLHDLQRDYLRKMREADLPDLHRHLLRAYAARLGVDDYPNAPLPWEQAAQRLAGDAYFWNHLVHHHLAAGWHDALYRLLTDLTTWKPAAWPPPSLTWRPTTAAPWRTGPRKRPSGGPSWRPLKNACGWRSTASPGRRSGSSPPSTTTCAGGMRRMAPCTACAKKPSAAAAGRAMPRPCCAPAWTRAPNRPSGSAPWRGIQVG
ncbi:MAG: hypothetical protein ACPL7C_12385 [Anaerolineae bacterium]